MFVDQTDRPQERDQVPQRGERTKSPPPGTTGSQRIFVQNSEHQRSEVILDLLRDVSHKGQVAIHSQNVWNYYEGQSFIQVSSSSGGQYHDEHACSILFLTF